MRVVSTKSVLSGRCRRTSDPGRAGRRERASGAGSAGLWMARRLIVLQQHGFPPRHPQLWKKGRIVVGAREPRGGRFRESGRRRAVLGGPGEPPDSGPVPRPKGRILFMCRNAHRVGQMPHGSRPMLFVLFIPRLAGKPARGIRVAFKEDVRRSRAAGAEEAQTGNVGSPGNRNTGLTTTGGERPVGPAPNEGSALPIHEASPPRPGNASRGIFFPRSVLPRVPPHALDVPPHALDVLPHALNVRPERPAARPPRPRGGRPRVTVHFRLHAPRPVPRVIPR